MILKIIVPIYIYNYKKKMSRIGKMPIVILEKVEATISGNNIKVKGPL